MPAMPRFVLPIKKIKEKYIPSFIVVNTIVANQDGSIIDSEIDNFELPDPVEIETEPIPEETTSSLDNIFREQILDRFLNGSTQTEKFVETVGTQTEKFLNPPTRTQQIQCTLHDEIERKLKLKRQELDTDSEEELLFYSPPVFEKLYKKEEDGRYTCLKCDKIAKNLVGVILHSRQHEERSTLCQFCGKLLPAEPARLRSHEKNHLQKRSLQLEKMKNTNQSNKFDESKTTCTSSTSTRHNSEPALSSEDIVPAKTKCCSVCGKSKFRTHLEYYDHMNTHSGNTPHKCSCLQEFRNYFCFMTHRKKYKCPLEGSTSPYWNGEIQRVRIRRERQRSWNERDRIKQLSLSKNENNSAASGDGEKVKINHRRKYLDYKCKLCNIEYPDAAHLRRHNQSKHMEKTLPCLECGMLFVTKSQLNKHIECHLAKLKCRICGSLIKKNEYRHHMSITHSKNSDNGKKPKSVRCHICKFEILTKNYKKHFTLLDHISPEIEWMKQYEIKRYPCVRCYKTYFENFKELTEHWDEAHGSINVKRIFAYLESLELKFEKNKNKLLPSTSTSEILK